jgi:hypothetical protein
MIEAYADLWTLPCDARCITTNGTIKSDGRAVMGRGVAKQATERYLGIAKILGAHLREHANHVGILVLTDDDGTGKTIPLVSFPVKHMWDQWADLDLIGRSADELVALTTRYGWHTVALPRPGCNNGKRNWETEVRPILLPILDDRFIVVTAP